jgi:hypothetical protein
VQFTCGQRNSKNFELWVAQLPTHTNPLELLFWAQGGHDLARRYGIHPGGCKPCIRPERPKYIRAYVRLRNARVDLAFPGGGLDSFSPTFSKRTQRKRQESPTLSQLSSLTGGRSNRQPPHAPIALLSPSPCLVDRKQTLWFAKAAPCTQTT